MRFRVTGISMGTTGMMEERESHYADAENADGAMKLVGWRFVRVEEIVVVDDREGRGLGWRVWRWVRGLWI